MDGETGWRLPLFHEQVYRFAHPELEGLSVSFTYPTIVYETLRLKRTQRPDNCCNKLPFVASYYHEMA